MFGKCVEFPPFKPWFAALALTLVSGLLLVGDAGAQDAAPQADGTQDDSAQAEGMPTTAPGEARAREPRFGRPALALDVAPLLGVYTQQQYWILLSARDEAADVGELPDRFRWRTTVRTRPIGAKADWRQSAGFAGGVSAATAYRGQLVVLRPDGSWATVDDAGVRPGPLPPDGWGLVAIAGRPDMLYAVARHVNKAAETDEAAETRTPDGGAALFVYDGRWSKLAELPGGPYTNLDVAVAAASANGAAEAIVLAQDGTSAEVFALRDGALVALTERVELAGELAGEARLVAAARPTLAVAAGGASAGLPAVLVLREGAWVRLPLSLAGEDVPAGERSAALVGTGPDGYRLLVLVRDGQEVHGPFEQVLDEAGGALGPMAQLPRPEPPTPRQDPLIMTLLVVMLLLVTMNAFRQRQEQPELKIAEQRLELAPHGRRLVAGLIDLSPILAVVAWGVASGVSSLEVLTGRSEETTTAMQIATMAYLGLTLSLELYGGRSLGKRATGLRVVGLDGQPTGVMPIVTRNLLRLFDLLLFVPLVFIVVSPLRQRVGDMAAGTVVVMSARRSPVGDEKAGAAAAAAGGESDEGREKSADASSSATPVEADKR